MSAEIVQFIPKPDRDRAKRAVEKLALDRGLLRESEEMVWTLLPDGTWIGKPIDTSPSETNPDKDTA